MAPHELRFTFDQDVSATVGPEDHFLTNLTTGEQIDSSKLLRSAYETATNTANFQLDLATYGSTVFQNGNYEDILLAPGVKNTAGEALAAEASLGFFVLAGDLNHDRLVTGDDYGVVDASLDAFPNGGALFWEGDGNYDGTVTGDDYGEIDAHFGTQVPEPPTAANSLIVTSAIGAGRIDLQWTAPSSGTPDGYRIFRSPNGVTYTLWDQVDDPNATTWFDPHLPDGAKYYYRVRAFTYADGNSHTTNETFAVTNLPGPGAVTTSLRGSTGLTLNWSDRTNDESNWEIWLSTDGTNFSRWGDPLAAHDPQGAMSHEVSGLSPASTYSFRVRATTAGQISVWSPTVQVTTLEAGVPIAPSGVTATAQGGHSMTISWQDNSDNEDGFNIEQQQPDGSWTSVGTADRDATTFTVGSLSSLTDYSFKVTAFTTATGGEGGGGSEGSPSDPVTGSTDYGDGIVYSGGPNAPEPQTFDGVSATWSGPYDRTEPPLGNDSITLTLNNLPEHYGLQLAFFGGLVNDGHTPTDTDTLTIIGLDEDVVRVFDPGGALLGLNASGDQTGDSVTLTIRGSDFEADDRWNIAGAQVALLRDRPSMGAPVVTVADTQDATVRVSRDPADPRGTPPFQSNLDVSSLRDDIIQPQTSQVSARDDQDAIVPLKGKDEGFADILLKSISGGGKTVSTQRAAHATISLSVPPLAHIGQKIHAHVQLSKATNELWIGKEIRIESSGGSVTVSQPTVTTGVDGGADVELVAERPTGAIAKTTITATLVDDSKATISETIEVRPVKLDAPRDAQVVSGNEYQIVVTATDGTDPVPGITIHAIASAGITMVNQEAVTVGFPVSGVATFFFTATQPGTIEFVAGNASATTRVRITP